MIKIFDVFLVMGIIALITLGTVFAGAMFSSVSLEGNSTHETETVQAYTTISAWVYVIASLLIIAVLVIAFKLYHTQS